ncbi:MAG: OadG family protein [Desulfuromonadaceae bacterium]|jgi:sodium pump decarboxylase gamma subunit
MFSFAAGIERIVAADGFSLTVTGMLIVFLALSIIALFISLLPKVLPLLSKIFPEIKHHHTSQSAASPRALHPVRDDALLAAIAYALYRRETTSLPRE